MNEIHLFLFFYGEKCMQIKLVQCREGIENICLSFFSYKENKGDGKVACNKCSSISESQ